MAKITETLGCFVETPCCTECNWFSQPLLVMAAYGIPLIPRSICPDCGAATESMTGKYKILTTKKWLSSKTEYIDFIRKNP